MSESARHPNESVQSLETSLEGFLAYLDETAVRVRAQLHAMRITSDLNARDRVADMLEAVKENPPPKDDPDFLARRLAELQQD